MCNNSPAEWTSSENWWRSAGHRYSTIAANKKQAMRKRAWTSVWKARVWTRLERRLVQILVVVANIQMRTLKTEVGKGSARTAIGRGLVGPKAKANAESMENLLLRCRKGKRLTSRYLHTDIMRQRKQSRRRRHVSLEEFSFLFN